MTIDDVTVRIPTGDYTVIDVRFGHGNLMVPKSLYFKGSFTEEEMKAQFQAKAAEAWRDLTATVSG